jgi:hypothetical protein
MQNFGALRQLSLGDLADDGRRERGERREKIMPSLMATSLRWRTHSARTNIKKAVTDDTMRVPMERIPNREEKSIEAVARWVGRMCSGIREQR